MKYASLLVTLAVFAYCLPANAQPSRDWDRTFGSPNWDEMHVATPAPGGGWLFGGNVTATGGTVSQPVFGLNDYWVVRVDEHGNKLWDKVFGGSDNDRLWSILPLPDGTWLLGGTSSSGVSGNKTTPNRGDADFWLLKISPDGEKLWERTFGGSGRDELFALGQFQDGNFLLGGWSNSPVSGDKTTDSLGVYDVWALKISPDGQIIWQERFGGTGLDNLYDAVPTPDGGFLLGGASASGVTATKSEPCRGYSDYWVVKIDEDGNREWDARFGGPDVDQLHKILPLSDGNFLLLGASMSLVGGDRTAANRGSFDFWTVKISPFGQKIRDNAYGGSAFDGATAAIETRGGQILLAGASNSPANGTKKSTGLGNYDYWLVATDADGNQLWDKSYGGAKSDAASTLVQNADGSLLLAGHSESNAGGFKSNNSLGFNDFWLLKTWCNVQVGLPSDTTFCSGRSLPFEVEPKNCAAGECDILWSTGARTASATLVVPDSAGFVSVFVEDRNGCSASDTLRFEVLPSPRVDLGRDTTLFDDDKPLTLNVFNENCVYNWNTGDGSPTLTVAGAGTFAVTVTAENGCSASDEIRVDTVARTLFVPNVFQPDLDIYNDTWFVQAKPGAVAELELIDILDSWGHRVFRAEHAQPNDKAFGWNGEVGGRRALPGVYTYLIRMKFPDGRTEMLFGTVTLVR